MIFAADVLNSRLQMAAIIGAVAMVLIVFEMVRRRKLMERYSLLWMFASLILLLLAISSGTLSKLSSWVGIATPSNALFGFGLAFAAFMLLHFSASMSRGSCRAWSLRRRRSGPSPTGSTSGGTGRSSSPRCCGSPGTTARCSSACVTR